MKKLTILLLLFIGVDGFSQEPPEYLDFIFKNSIGEIIFPEISIIENNVMIDFENQNLYIKSDTIKIDFQDKLNGIGYQFLNDNNELVSRVSSINFDHFLGEEIIMIAKYKKKIMRITFFGQSMQNFNVWGNGYKSQNSNIITFNKGSYLYLVNGFSEKRNINELKHLIKWKNENLFFNADKYKIEKSKKFLNDYFGVIQLKEIIELNTLLQNKTEKYIYFGYIFENRMPIGYGLINREENTIIYLNKKIVKKLRKYYR